MNNVKTFVSLLIISVIPVWSEQVEIEIDCSGRNGVTTSANRYCVSERWEKSYKALKVQFPIETLQRWKLSTEEVCAASYALYRERHLHAYPALVIGCQNRLNEFLLEELD